MSVICPKCAKDGTRTVMIEITATRDRVKQHGDRFPDEPDPMQPRTWPPYGPPIKAGRKYLCPQCEHKATTPARLDPPIMYASGKDPRQTDVVNHATIGDTES